MVDKMEAFGTQFKSFLNGVIEKLTAHQTQINQYQNITTTEGKRYIKVIVGSSAWCFIDKNNGDVLKSASWNAPAKGARGNIFDEHNGLKYLTAYGPMSYSRGRR